MAAVFIFQACRIGELILFSVNCLSLFGTVGLLPCSARTDPGEDRGMLPPTSPNYIHYIQYSNYTFAHKS